MVSPTVALLASLTAVIAVWWLGKAIYQAFFSAIAKVPGPFLTRFTALPYHYHCLVRTKQAQYLHNLHQKYGDVVRFSPREVSIGSLEGHKAIHRIGSGFIKSDYYHYLSPSHPGEPPYGLFQMSDVDDHAARRRLLARGFTTTYLRSQWEEMVREKVDSTILGIKRDALESGNGEVDVRKWCFLMPSEVVAHLMFGKSFNGLQVGKPDHFLEVIEMTVLAGAFKMYLPWLYAILRRVPLFGSRKLFDAHKISEAKGQIAVENSRANATDRNLFANIMSQAEKDKTLDGGLTDADINYEAGAFLIAGSDTTASTLTYAIWKVLADPQLRKELESEVEDQPMTDAHLETLPVLSAVILETLRLYAAAPGPEPRIVPKGGHQFHDYYLPEGTVVSTQPWTLHRDPRSFENPDQFDHTRWLPTGSAAKSATATAAWVPFGAGTRTCIGRHLAEMELRLTIAAFFQRCKGARLAAETTEESMEVMSFNLIHPKSGQCKIVIE